MKLISKVFCAGCGVCRDACPKGAIALRLDKWGFLYPKVDSMKCVDCGLCKKICPAQRGLAPQRPVSVRAVKSKDDALRLVSSSGGVFTLLARQILSRGGKVFGAAFYVEDWSVKHIGIEDESRLCLLQGSKYLQSNCDGVYRQVKEDLTAGREVLFSGTPCQIAALRAYLNLQPSISTSNLFLVEVICHGVPSGLAWKKYLEYQEAALAEGRGSALAEGRKIESISFRRKNCGWKRFSLSLRFANDRENPICLDQDYFMRAFLGELCSRPSCLDCRFKALRSGADITLGDYWNVAERFPDMDDDKGTSLVLLNTEKGLRLFESLRAKVIERESDYAHACKTNGALYRSVEPHYNRNRFLIALAKGKLRFDRLVEKYEKRTIVDRIRGRLFKQLGIKRVV